MPDAPRRIPGIVRRPVVEFTFGERTVRAHEGESIAAALLAEAVWASCTTRKRGEPRGYFCGMGVCWECVVEVEGHGPARACRTPVAVGLRVRPVTA